MTPSEALAQVCSHLRLGDHIAAAATLTDEYPFVALKKERRSANKRISTGVFLRDGFIDRYSGDRLIFPGALRLVALKIPEAFPYHLNWKMSETHLAVWQLSATIDHAKPIARGGDDKDVNMLTTSMLRNSAKSNWSLRDLGWAVRPPGDCNEWDGLMSWFRAEVDADPSLLKQPFVREWSLAAKNPVKARPFEPEVD